MLSEPIHFLALYGDNYIIALKDRDGFDPILTNYNLLLVTDMSKPASTTVRNDNSRLSLRQHVLND